ncbi:MAG: 1,4-alpha-glucan branching enzyme [Solirubrobacteraceae bacterium]|nr:1,4-alpha-glucan branching enzyme [Solirubrobacteraceae bacterium]
MPYVEGFGTWPFGEEWLWEAMATSYLPLLAALDERPGQVTVSVTPVLADQWAVPGIGTRFVEFMRGVREASHALDLQARPDLAGPLELSLERYRSAARGYRDLVAGFAQHATWTSAATHAVLPLLATDAGVRLQVETGVDAFRARFGAWDGGFWLPECAHEPWLDARLEAVGVRVCCVELTDLGIARGPLRTAAGPVLVPIDRSVIDLVWGRDGYPSGAAYLATHNYTPREHLAWAVDGSLYDPDRAAEQVRVDAADFVARVAAGDGLCVCAIDTELLGHWWVEGVDWLAAVLDECARVGLEVAPLTADVETVDCPPLPATSWGQPRDLSTWSGPAARGLAWRARRAELAVLKQQSPNARQVRELLALQSSDWAFLVSRDTAGPYPLERFAAHERNLYAPPSDPAVRGLAPFV